MAANGNRKAKRVLIFILSGTDTSSSKLISLGLKPVAPRIYHFIIVLVIYVFVPVLCMFRYVYNVHS